jgi:hypothetical protein
MAERRDPSGGIYAVGTLRHQRDADVAAARVDSMCVPGEIPPGQHGDMRRRKQVARERLIISPGNAPPEIEAGVRARRVHHRLEDRYDGVELGAVLMPVLFDVRLISPRRDTGMLNRQAHRAAVIGAIEQEVTKQRGIAGHGPGSQTRRVRSLGQADEHHETTVVVASELEGCRESAEWCRAAVIVDIGLAFVGGNCEAVPIRELEQHAPFIARHHPAGRIGRRADVDELRS